MKVYFYQYRTHSSGTSANRQTKPSTSCLDRRVSMAATSSGLILPPLAPSPVFAAWPLPSLFTTSLLVEPLALFSASESRVVTDTGANVDVFEVSSCPWGGGAWPLWLVSFEFAAIDIALVFSSREVIWVTLADPSSWRMASASDRFSRTYFNVNRMIRRALWTRHVAMLLWQEWGDYKLFHSIKFKEVCCLNNIIMQKVEYVSLWNSKVTVFVNQWYYVHRAVRVSWATNISVHTCSITVTSICLKVQSWPLTLWLISEVSSQFQTLFHQDS